MRTFTASMPPSNRAAGAVIPASDHNLLTLALAEVRANVPNQASEVGAASTTYADSVGTAVRAQSVGVVLHGGTASTARPTGWASILWIGAVSPTNGDPTRDLWLDTSAV